MSADTIKTLRELVNALEQVTTSETFYRDPRGDHAGPAIDAGVALIAQMQRDAVQPAWLRCEFCHQLGCKSQQDDHAGSPAPSEPVAPILTLSADDAAFLAARLRRLFSHFGYSLPAFAAEDASLIRIAGSCIGAVLTQLGAPSAQSSKAALSDDEIVQLARRHTVLNGSHEFCNYIAFARAILARAGIGESRREPLTDDDRHQLQKCLNGGISMGWITEAQRDSIERGILASGSKE